MTLQMCCCDANPSVATHCLALASIFVLKLPTESKPHLAARRILKREAAVAGKVPFKPGFPLMSKTSGHQSMVSEDPATMGCLATSPWLGRTSLRAKKAVVNSFPGVSLHARHLKG